jgi:hypothetical protein
MRPLSYALLTLLAGGAAAQLPVIGQPTGPELPLSRNLLIGDARMSCTYMEMGGKLALSAGISGAEGDFFLVFAQDGWSGFVPSSSTYLATGTLDRTGWGSARAILPGYDQFPRNYELGFFALYFSHEGGMRVTPPAPMLINPWPLEVLDFDWSAGGERLHAGLPVRDEWTDLGIHIQADNADPAHPDLAILFDSAAPTGEDFDLSTPGYGWQNRTPEGKLLIIAEDDEGLDRFGFVTDPDDEARGGTIFFRFDQPVVLAELTLIDVDPSETAAMRCYGDREMLDWATVPGMGDNARQVIGFGAEPVTELQVDLRGSAGIASLSLMPCPVRVGYDTTTTGVPIGLQVGEVFTDQLAPSLGFSIAAQSRVGDVDRAVVFDTANPTGGDRDLMTPGYHRTNLVPLGRVLVLADSAIDRDHDGLIDDPGDDENGGWMTIDFKYDVVFQSATVIDVNRSQRSFFTLYDAAGRVVGHVPLIDLGDNAVLTVAPGVPGVRKVVLDLGGTGALAGFEFCRDMGPRAGY